MTTHELKCWPEFFEPMERGDKTFDVRINDGREYAVGDLIVEKEWDPATSEYTGRELQRYVTYILSAETGRRFGAPLSQGWMVLALSIEAPA